MPPSVEQALQKHRLKQHEAGLFAGSAWEEQGQVFRSRTGGPTNRQQLRLWFRRDAQAAGVPVCRWHDMRHVYVSLLLTNGTLPAVVAAIAGHATIRTALQTYAHAFDADRRAAVSTIEQVLEA